MMFSPNSASVALVSRTEAFAQTDQQQQRSDSPGNAEHGEERAQLVGPQGAEDLRQDVQDHPHNHPHCSFDVLNEDKFRSKTRPGQIA